MYTVKDFPNRDALQDYLNGVILGQPLAAPVLGLDGLTFAVTPQGGSKITVTFSDADGAGLLPQQVLSQITAASTQALDGKVALRNYGYTNSKNPQLAVVQIGAVVDAAGTANALLGFPATQQTVAEISTSAIEAIVFNSSNATYTVITHA